MWLVDSFEYTDTSHTSKREKSVTPFQHCNSGKSRDIDSLYLSFKSSKGVASLSKLSLFQEQFSNEPLISIIEFGVSGI